MPQPYFIREKGNHKGAVEEGICVGEVTDGGNGEHDQVLGKGNQM